jgi:cupin fold WbuC family metalloprotein
MILPFHSDGSDVHQRMLNAIQPGSYIRPHRHHHPPKSETIVILQGALKYVVFDDRGAIEEVFMLSSDGLIAGIDTEPGVFHTFLAVRPNSVVFESKTGPYDPASDKDFAPWAPAEEDKESARVYLEDLIKRTNLLAENG